MYIGMGHSFLSIFRKDITSSMLENWPRKKTELQRPWRSPLTSTLAMSLCSIREDDFFVMLKLHKQQVMGWIGDLLNARILGQCV